MLEPIGPSHLNRVGVDQPPEPFGTIAVRLPDPSQRHRRTVDVDDAVNLPGELEGLRQSQRRGVAGRVEVRCGFVASD